MVENVLTDDKTGRTVKGASQFILRVTRMFVTHFMASQATALETFLSKPQMSTSWQR